MTSLDTRALHLARRWFGRAAAARVFEPLIADWQHEAAQAPPGRARVVAHIRGSAAVATSCVLVALRVGLASTHARRVGARAAVTIVGAALAHAWFHRDYPAAVATAMTATDALTFVPLALLTALRLERRFARAWRPLVAATALAVVGQAAVVGWLKPWAYARALAAAGATLDTPLHWPLPALVRHGLHDTAIAAETYGRVTAVAVIVLSALLALAIQRGGSRRHSLGAWWLVPIVPVWLASIGIARAVATRVFDVRPVEATWLVPLLVLALLAGSAVGVAETHVRTRVRRAGAARPTRAAELPDR